MPDFIWIILGVLGGALALWYLLVLCLAAYVVLKKD